MAERILSLEEMGEAAYQISSGTAISEVASTYRLSQKEFENQYNRYWDRWHQLRNIKQERDFSPEETVEYLTIEKAVSRRDKREAAKCRKATKPLLKEHGKRISSLRKLTEGLRKSLR
jgi:hypothetical protein